MTFRVGEGVVKQNSSENDEQADDHGSDESSENTKSGLSFRYDTWKGQGSLLKGSIETGCAKTKSRILREI